MTKKKEKLKTLLTVQKRLGADTGREDGCNFRYGGERKPWSASGIGKGA